MENLRTLHPHVFIGTATDRYAGWLGTVYTPELYQGRITRRSHRVGGKEYSEEILPVDSVREYFEHFSILEIDFTFYRPLLEWDGRLTASYHILKGYRKHLKEEDRLFLKVPRGVLARRVPRGGSFIDNESYLDPDFFSRRFHSPAMEILGPCLAGFVFEQEYQRKKERLEPPEMARELDGFFGSIPDDDRYHLELRTEALLSTPVFEILEKHGVGQILSHWTWLPSLMTQFQRSEGRIFNRKKDLVIRLMTPHGMRYEESYARAFPFDSLVEGMLSRTMVEETVALMGKAVDRGWWANVIINNRAGGSAPAIARIIAEEFSGNKEEGAGD
jgi:uncharacterized protein YecE (DUF72 family)